MSLFQKEIQELIDENIINQETATAINNYYQLKENNKAKSSTLTNIITILGVILVSLGIILLIAHNWDELSKTLKTIFAFVPLVIGQSLCLYTIQKQSDSKTWREASAVVLFFAVASSISLISQVYHVDGTLDGFLVAWICLTIPVAFLMRSSVTALLLMATSTWYALIVGYNFFVQAKQPYLYLGFMILLLAYYFIHIYKKTESNNFIWFNWLIAASFAICLGSFMNKSLVDFKWLSLSYFALFTLYFLIGQLPVMKDNRFYSNPFGKIGTVGIIIMLAMYSFKTSWLNYNYVNEHLDSLFSSLYFYILLLEVGCIAYILLKKDSSLIKHPFFISFILFFILIFLNGQMPILSAILINVMILSIAIYYINKGNALNHFGILNFGLLLIALLGTMRFFDEGIPFIWRGIFFMLTGVGFFVANIQLSKKRKSLQNNS